MFKSIDELLKELSVDWHIFNPEIMNFEFEDTKEEWPYCITVVGGKWCGWNTGPCPKHS